MDSLESYYRTIYGDDENSNHPSTFEKKPEIKSTIPTVLSSTADAIIESQPVKYEAFIEAEPSYYQDIYNSQANLDSTENIESKKAKKYQFTHDNSKYNNTRKFIRAAGGTLWEDATLADWDESNVKFVFDKDDFRIFCGDLGNDVTDDVLFTAFSKYKSISKARVVRDKRTRKSKGYGFVSFHNYKDYLAAMREMNGKLFHHFLVGKFVGSRPLKLKKSNWKDRSLK
ncbi:hypothetical protein ROZALSC1DRAFT_29241 [Rozella allomycis CSF55]|uniref:Nucleotide-binding, alpha-beta plait domain-containing protein n=1 Tax=Rozella allomycis (strain CSF55) TaxID=988480 RepID=A0A075AY70_ROZAC|nr:Nucleotide-binding, alpha-beta plait domain-containing protein [Rozella allomycis CSF55]RKP19128.1 hypothetical protein ROZALSC1DRAFT_29241 [Rozella allomycis CSF55]|eukprot:EPZ35212.1 Nucleotide-binding, alpha-beta plait domain-containing protein [Rozella allomycis CSF55]